MSGARPCVYCLDNGQIEPRQVLFRGEHLYLCAPRGQMIEGYLAISPYRCVGCLAHFPPEWFAELARLKAIVAGFYRAAYRVAQPVFYEQGRGGRGAVTDRAGGFPLHAHLCALPAAVDLHGLLARHYAAVPVPGPEALPEATGHRPYIYAEAPDAQGCVRMAAYRAASPAQDILLEQARLKPLIAAEMNMPERGDWRAYPGDEELARLIERFAAFQANATWTSPGSSAKRFP